MRRASAGMRPLGARRRGQSRRVGALVAVSIGFASAAADGQLPEAPGLSIASASASLRLLPRSDAGVEIDGVLDDALWQRALVIELDTETSPGENVKPPVETTAYLVEDGARLLIAFDAREPDLDSIRAYLRDRDTAYNDDFVGIVIDSFGDQRYGYEFFVNALGVQMDLSQDDVNGNENDNWDAIWDSAGRIDEDGFAVEMAIPLSQLRFARTDGERVWGIDVLRFRPRTARTRISNNPIDRGSNCYLCQFERIRGLAGVEPSRNLEIVPSLTTGRTDQQPDPLVDSLEKGDSETEVGLNVRWAMTRDLTANLALNPDFSQVEADVPKLEINSQFALSYPESRPFFLEGADYFATPMDAVFTRTVADPDVGAKLTGQVNDNTIGLFAAQDAITNLLFPGALSSPTHSLDQPNDAFVGRYVRRVGDSQLGALITTRSGDDYHNDVAGIDGRFRISDQHEIQVQYLHSDTGYPEATALAFAQPLEDFAGDAWEVDYEFQHRDWEVELSHSEFDAGFRADSGFIPRVDMELQGLEAFRIWQRGGRPWNQISAGVNAYTTHDTGGQLLDQEIEPEVSFNGPLQSYIEVGGGPGKTFWDGQLYDRDSVYLFGQIRPRGGLNVQLNVSQGDAIDFANSRLGYEKRIRPNVEWNINQHLLLRVQHTGVRFDMPDGDSIFDADLTDLRVTWQFNVRSFLRFTMQRQLVERNVAVFVAPDTEAETLTVGTQLLYSYKVNPQTVLYLGYSDNHLDDDELVDLTRTDRTFFAKLSYAWLR
jgi:Domain of unknown function (DUF5916)/Carbohydrate family 9 binding domain-like